MLTSDGDTGRAQTCDDDVVHKAREWRNKMVEMVVETDDALLEEYLAEKEIPADQLRAGLRKATCSLGQ